MSEHNKALQWKSYPWASIVAISLDCNWNFLRISNSQSTKRVINAFSIYVSLFACHHSLHDDAFPMCIHHIFGVKVFAKIQIIFYPTNISSCFFKKYLLPISLQNINNINQYCEKTIGSPNISILPIPICYDFAQRSCTLWIFNVLLHSVFTQQHKTSNRTTTQTLWEFKVPPLSPWSL